MSKSHYLCREQYRLEVHWSNIVYHSDTEATLEGAYLSGPVLQNALQLVSPDFIDLDMTPQLIKVLDSYYVIRLSWQGTRYNPDETITLESARISNKFLKEFHKLGNTDFILINTEKHEESTHAYNLMYDSRVMRADKSPYTYGG